MFLSKTLHTELLKAAEQNGVNKMLTWGGVGAGVGGAYGMFSDTDSVIFEVEVGLYLRAPLVS